MRQWKYTVKDYQKCASEGFTLAETAKYLGVSPQAVYFTTKRHNLIFYRKDKRGGFRLRTSPKTFDGTVSGERERRCPEKVGVSGGLPSKATKRARRLRSKSPTTRSASRLYSDKSIGC